MRNGQYEFSLFKNNDIAETSLLAYDVILPNLARIQQEVLEVIKSFGQQGCISDEVRGVMDTSNYGTVTGRFSELFRKGFIEYSGTRKGQSGRYQRVMVAL
jgi:hypothetical protein